MSLQKNMHFYKTYYRHEGNWINTSQRKTRYSTVKLDVSTFSIFFRNQTVQIGNWLKWRHFQNKCSNINEQILRFLFLHFRLPVKVPIYFIYLFFYLFCGFSCFVLFWWDKVRRNSKLSSTTVLGLMLKRCAPFSQFCVTQGVKCDVYWPQKFRI